MVRRLVGALLAGLVLLTTVACTSRSAGSPVAAPLKITDPTTTTATSTAAEPTKSSTAAAEEKKIGKAQTVKDDGDSAVITLVSVRTSTKGEDGVKPKSGTYVIFLLKFEGKSGTVSINSLYAQLKTPDGKMVDAAAGNGFMNTVEPDLPLKDLGPGQTVEGTVVLDTPLVPGSKLLWLDPLDKPLAEWAL